MTSMKGRQVRCLPPRACSLSAIKCILYSPIRFDRKVVQCILQLAAVHLMGYCFPKATIYLPLNLKTLFWCTRDMQLVEILYNARLVKEKQKGGNAHFSPSTERHLPKQIPSSCRSPGRDKKLIRHPLGPH